MFILLRKLLGFTSTFRAVYMICGPRACEQGHLFSELQEKYFSLELAALKLSRETQKLSSAKISAHDVFHSGKILKIIIFTRGPRTKYCSLEWN